MPGFQPADSDVMSLRGHPGHEEAYFFYFTIFLILTLNTRMFLLLLILERERGSAGREKERKGGRKRQKHQLVASPMVPYWGSNPQPKCMI